MYEETHEDLRKPPRVGHRPLNFYKLYVAVQRRGGHSRVSQWKDLADVLELPATVTNSGYVLRKNYEKYLLPIEERLRAEFRFLAAAVSEDSEQLSAMGTREMVEARRRSAANADLAGETRPNPPAKAPQVSASQLRAMGASPNLSFASATSPAAALTVDNGARSPQHPFILHRADQILPSFTDRAKATAGPSGHSGSASPGGSAAGPSTPDNLGNIFQMPTVTSLSLTNIPFTDRMISEFLRAYPSLQYLKLGSLRLITKLPPPTALPPTLRVLELVDVPQNLIGNILDSYSSLRLISLRVTPWPPVFGRASAHRLTYMARLAQASIQAHGGGLLLGGKRVVPEAAADHDPQQDVNHESEKPPGTSSAGGQEPRTAGTTYLVRRVPSSGYLPAIAADPLSHISEGADEPETFRLPPAASGEPSRQASDDTPR